MPEYHNPDPLVRLIGDANEAPAIVEGVPITSLVDSGACMSAMVKSFAKELRLEIKPLKTILDIEGTGGGTVPYYGYVECRLKLPQIEKFDVDVLMLIIDDSAYGMRVPVQLGTLHIDMALDLATEAEMKKLSRRWERAKMATALRMNSMVVDENSFKLDDISGSVHTTQKLNLRPFESATVTGILKGPVKNSVYHKRVNVSIEPLEAHKEGENKYCAVPGYAFLKPGSDRVKVMIKNLTARVIKVQQGSKVASLEAANVVPHMLAPQETQSPQTNVKTMKSTNVEVSSKDLPTSSKNLKNDGRCATSMGVSNVAPSGDPIEVAPSKPEVDRTPLSSEQMKILFEQIKFEEGTAEWTEEQKHRVKSVIEKYSFLFAMNNLDQGQTFNGKLFEALCKEAKILKLRTSPYHPQTNGQPERFNRMLMTMLGTLPEDKKINWQDWVSTLCHAYNSTVTKVTGYSPYFLMFGRQPRIPVDEEFGVTFPKTTRNTMKKYVQSLQQRLQWAYEIAKEHIEKEVSRRKLYYDRKVHCMDIIPGDIVLVRQKVFGTQHKIEDRWELPVYKVVEQCGDNPLYKVQKIGGVGSGDVRVLHRNMLFPFIGVRETDEDNTEEEVRCLPEKSLLDPRVAALRQANYFMETYFDEDL